MAKIVQPISPVYGLDIARHIAPTANAPISEYTTDCRRVGHRSNHRSAPPTPIVAAVIATRTVAVLSGPAGLHSNKMGTAVMASVKANVAYRQII
ncbi:hypothetical protein [Mycolicibacterium pulveris]|uniref:hypothetical protein n=1 Tax=Mycolicibacterium pulveris TaxID=36813 RepID=UPI001F261C06|nr:hypothetical protein [Mycolicibacterium pulveris]